MLIQSPDVASLNDTLIIKILPALPQAYAARGPRDWGNASEAGWTSGLNGQMGSSGEWMSTWQA